MTHLERWAREALDQALAEAESGMAISRKVYREAGRGSRSIAGDDLEKTRREIADSFALPDVDRVLFIISRPLDGRLEAYCEAHSETGERLALVCPYRKRGLAWTKDGEIVVVDPPDPLPEVEAAHADLEFDEFVRRNGTDDPFRNMMVETPTRIVLPSHRRFIRVRSLGGVEPSMQSVVDLFRGEEGNDYALAIWREGGFLTIAAWNLVTGERCAYVAAVRKPLIGRLRMIGPVERVADPPPISEPSASAPPTEADVAGDALSDAAAIGEAPVAAELVTEPADEPIPTTDSAEGIAVKEDSPDDAVESIAENGPQPAEDLATQQQQPETGQGTPAVVDRTGQAPTVRSDGSSETGPLPEDTEDQAQPSGEAGASDEPALGERDSVPSVGAAVEPKPVEQEAIEADPDEVESPTVEVASQQPADLPNEAGEDDGTVEQPGVSSEATGDGDPSATQASGHPHEVPEAAREDANQADDEPDAVDDFSPEATPQVSPKPIADVSVAVLSQPTDSDELTEAVVGEVVDEQREIGRDAEGDVTESSPYRPIPAAMVGDNAAEMAKITLWRGWTLIAAAIATIVSVWGVSTALGTEVQSEVFLLQDGWVALEDGDWRLASATFGTAMDERGRTPAPVAGLACASWITGHQDSALFFHQIYLGTKSRPLSPDNACIGDLSLWGVAQIEVDGELTVFPMAISEQEQRLEEIVRDETVHAAHRSGAMACLSHGRDLRLVAGIHLQGVAFHYQIAAESEEQEEVPPPPAIVEECIDDLSPDYGVTQGTIVPKDSLQRFFLSTVSPIPQSETLPLPTPRPLGPDGQEVKPLGDSR